MLKEVDMLKNKIYTEIRLKPGDKLNNNRYEIIRFVNEGGMAIVYEAIDLKTSKRRCAIKRPRFLNRDGQLRFGVNESAMDRETKYMSLVEAQSLFPSIFESFREKKEGVRATDDGQVEMLECSYVAMEFIAGRDLSSVLENVENRRLSVAQTIRIGTEVAEGLSMMHQANIV
ncbi:MAG: hypothetical protein IJO93_01605, partial [Clostridia bacterium]|nr:hypothetical protein [Clostridia bacterium]